MKEFDRPITINKGLRTDSRIGRGLSREFAHEINRLTPKAFGLRPSSLTAITFSPAQETTWPFPQIFPTHDWPILLGAESVSLVDDSAELPWPVTAQPLFDFDTGLADASIVSGDLWDGTLHEALGVFTNGENVVIRDNSGVFTGTANRVFISPINVNSICSHDGRLIYGGIAPADMWTEDWKAIFEEFVLNSPLQFDYESADDIRQNFIFWSGIRNGTDLWPLRKPSLEEWREVFRSQSAGFSPTPTRGSVLRVLPIGGGFVVYTEDAIYFATPLEVDGVLTYGFDKISRVGILGKGAVSGTKDEHVFADERGDLWRLTPARQGRALQVEKLGYREFFNSFTDDQMVISYDALEDEYWITGEIDGFLETKVLSKEGLGHAQQNPTSLHVLDGVLYGVAAADSQDGEYRFVSEVIDFRTRDLKTITFIEIGASGVGAYGLDQIMVAVDFKYDTQDAWTRSPWVPLNPEGFGRIQITALEFRAAVKWDTGSEEAPELDYANVKWQPSGRRTTRGLTSAPEAVA